YTRLEVGGTDIEDASYDPTSSENVGRLTVRPDAILHGDDGGVGPSLGDIAAGGLDVLRLDREEDDVGTPIQGRRGGQTDHMRPLETFHKQAVRLDRLDLSRASNELYADPGLAESRSEQTPDR